MSTTIATPIATPSASATPILAVPVTTPSTAASPSAAATGIVPVPPPASAPPASPWRADWLIAGGLVLLGGVALLLWQRRRKGSIDPAADEPALSSKATEPFPPRPPAPSPEPAVAPQGARMAASPATAAPRARLTVALRPRRGGINLLTATLDAELEIVNDGDVPASAIHVAARLLSAHRDQQAELDALFAAPHVRPAVAPFVLGPGEARVLPLLLTLPRAAIRPIDLGGRAMFVPVAAVDVRYAGGAGEAQSAAAFAVGVARAGAAKLAPFGLDGPVRMHETLGARPHGEPLLR